MRSNKNKPAVTLIEILITMAIMALLAAMVITIAARIENKNKEQLTQNTFAIIDAALGQFRDYGYTHKDYSKYTGSTKIDFYRSLDFPIDCNNATLSEVETAIGDAIGLTVSVEDGGGHDPNFSGSEVLYFFLNQVPACRSTIDKVDESLITYKGEKPTEPNMIISLDGGRKRYPLYRFIDPWGETIRYDYYDEREGNYNTRKKGKKNFPVITSAGADGVFNTDDDVVSR